MATRMQQRRGTLADWTAANPVLMDGEIGFETDTHMVRVGDGVTPFLSLPQYVGPVGPQGSQGNQGVQGSQGTQGTQGVQGFQGTQGNIGATGSTGVEPTGAVLMFGGASAPTGYLLCDGAAVSRSTYAALFTAIGTAYGVGDGSTTFNLPNLKGKVPVGFDTAETEFNALGKTGGEKTHLLTNAELASHNHMAATGSTTPNHQHTFSYNWSVNFTKTGNGTGVADIGNHTGGAGTAETQTVTSDGSAHTHTIPISGSDQAHNNLQPYITMNYIIKT